MSMHRNYPGWASTYAVLLALAWLSGCNATNPPTQSSAHLSRASEPSGDIPAPVQQTPFLPQPKLSAPPETYTVTVSDVSVKELLFALARDAKLNLDIHPNVSGTVTLNAVKQTLPQILSRIAEQISLRYEVVGPNLVISPDVPHVRTYKVDYLNMTRETKSNVSVATEIATTGGSVKAGGGGSAGNKSNTEVNITSNNNFWELLEKNVAAILGGGENLVITNPLSGVISVRATSRQHEQIQAFLDRILSNVQRQVLIEATIVEVELNNRYQSGVDWSLVSQTNGVSASSTLVGGNLATPPSFLLSYNKAAGSFDKVFAALHMLETFGNVKVLSSPKIMALNNQTALLKVVDEKVYFTTSLEIKEATTNSPERRTYTSEIHTVPVGLVMSVTSQITDDDRVTINVRPTISRITGYVIDPAQRLAGSGFDNLIPEIQIREMESLLKIDSNQIAVLGGLMQNKVSKSSAGIPLLSSLPWIGHLFSYKDDELTKTELVIFLRPTVMRNASLSTELKDFRRFLPEVAPGVSQAPNTEPSNASQKP